VLICGDSPADKREAATLIERIGGLRCLDCGRLEMGAHHRVADSPHDRREDRPHHSRRDSADRFAGHALGVILTMRRRSRPLHFLPSDVMLFMHSASPDQVFTDDGHWLGQIER
jgi:hypothetical protein